MGESMSEYKKWTVNQLKKELISRGAVTSGRKENLIERLESYDRNANFTNDVDINIPPPILPDWPSTGFRQLTADHKVLLPKITNEQTFGYFEHRLATDLLCTGNAKAIIKGEKLLHSNIIGASSVHLSSTNVYFTGIVGAEMKKMLSYNYKIRINTKSGDPVNSDCECPAGKGPHSTCKHVAAVFLMLVRFTESGELCIRKSCTENLQQFHKPKRSYDGSPRKAQGIPGSSRYQLSLDDPRPMKFRKMDNYNEHVKNVIFNYCSNTGKDITMRYLYPRDACALKYAQQDHDYLDRPFLTYWVDNSLAITGSSASVIERETRGQSQSKRWFHERNWRITASRFGEVCKATKRRNMDKLCKTFVEARTFSSIATNHGKLYESKAVSQFQSKTGLKVKKAGLFICVDKPYLGASPDGIIDDDDLVEVKCPYSGRNEIIQPSKIFPFLELDENDCIQLKQTHAYYMQVQGQLHITKKKCCYFVVYTFVDLLVCHRQRLL